MTDELKPATLEEAWDLLDSRRFLHGHRESLKESFEVIMKDMFGSPAPAELSVGDVSLQKLLKLIDAMPRTDRGFSWEARDWQGNEAIRAYGANAAVLKFLLDNTDTIAADLRAALSSPMGGNE